ncbi:MAG: hypothetical protein IK083_10180 [Abditibacteriota bacterium]|nr:hypothetical protein [Abditibacteriota bacterium]
MACFLVSAAEAVVATVACKVMEKKEKSDKKHGGIPFSVKLGWLRNMLWGGTALLAFEHVWHGEVTPWAPFLTAMSDPADTAEMLGEMSTVGVSMACLVTGVWLVMLGVSAVIEKRAAKRVEAEG